MSGEPDQFTGGLPTNCYTNRTSHQLADPPIYTVWYSPDGRSSQSPTFGNYIVSIRIVYMVPVAVSPVRRHRLCSLQRGCLFTPEMNDFMLGRVNRGRRVIADAEFHQNVFQVSLDRVFGGAESRSHFLVAEAKDDELRRSGRKEFVVDGGGAGPSIRPKRIVRNFSAALPALPDI